MKLEILIATMEDRLSRVAEMLLDADADIAYLVSCQYMEECPKVPAELACRDDVRVVFLKGRGLSNNRNYALQHAVNDVVLIADDDCRYTLAGLKQVIATYEVHPEVDIALFKVDGMSKYYPASQCRYQMEDFQGSYSVASVEMSLRRSSLRGVHFDEYFGLGSDRLASGEEQVFLYDALQKGLRIEFFPVLIGQTPGGTTGELFLQDEKVQYSKGATFCYLFGPRKARMMCLKETLHYFVHKRVNPFKLMRNMNFGIVYAELIKLCKK